MSTTSKSPERILQVAHSLEKQRLLTYSHRFSPKKFTLPQLFACLVLKKFVRLDYRKLFSLFEDAPSLVTTTELKQVPRFSTFQKAAARLLISRRVQRLLDETVKAATKHREMRKNVTLAAIDCTGFESHHISAHFVRQRKHTGKGAGRTATYSRFPTANLLCDATVIQSWASLQVEAQVLTIRTSDPHSNKPRVEPNWELYRPILATIAKRLMSTLDSNAMSAPIIPPKRGQPTRKRLRD